MTQGVNESKYPLNKFLECSDCLRFLHESYEEYYVGSCIWLKANDDRNAALQAFVKADFTEQAHTF